MKEGFIDFSRLKLNEAPTNPVAVEKQGSEAAATGGQAQREGTRARREAQGVQMAAKTGSPTQATNIQKNITERFFEIRSEKEYNKLLEAEASDWRKDLTAEDPNEPNHPYVKVMPHIKYKEIEAAKELAAAAKTKSLGEETMDMSRGMSSRGFRQYLADLGEGYKKFPRAKVQDKAATKPDTAKGELQARRMDRARTAHTDKRTKDDAVGAVKEREQDNRKAGLEKLVKKTPTHKNTAYKLEGQRRRDLDARAKRTSKGHSKEED